MSQVKSLPPPSACFHRSPFLLFFFLSLIGVLHRENRPPSFPFFPRLLRRGSRGNAGARLSLLLPRRRWTRDFSFPFFPPCGPGVRGEVPCDAVRLFFPAGSGHPRLPPSSISGIVSLTFFFFSSSCRPHVLTLSFRGEFPDFFFFFFFFPSSLSWNRRCNRSFSPSTSDSSFPSPPPLEYGGERR